MKNSALRAKMAAAAQAVYDAWGALEQSDPDGFEMEYGGGGICHLIADAFCEVLDQEGFSCRTVSDMMSSAGVHVFAAFEYSGAYYSADIPCFIYEKGFAYSFSRVPDVHFDASDVSIERLSWTQEDFESEDY